MAASSSDDIPEGFGAFWWYIGYSSSDDSARHDSGSGLPSYYRTPVREQTLLEMHVDRGPGREQPAVEAWKTILALGGVALLVLLCEIVLQLSGALPGGMTSEFVLYLRSPVPQSTWAFSVMLALAYRWRRSGPVSWASRAMHLTRRSTQ